MKKRIFTFGFYSMLGIAFLFLSSCKKDEPKSETSQAFKIIANEVFNSSSAINTVKAYAWWETDYDYGSDVIATAPYQNGGFSLELPKTLPGKYLHSLDFFSEAGITVSNSEARVYLFDDIEGYDVNDNNQGYFYLEEEIGDNSYYTSWMYADRDVTISGTIREIYEDDDEDISQYDLKLKKGWNAVYDSYLESYDYYNDRTIYTYSLTTQKPAGITYHWYFYSYYKGAVNKGSRAHSLINRLKDKRMVGL